MSKSLTLANTRSVGVIADLEGTVLSDTDRQILAAQALSGLILFARNYESPSQLCELVTSVRSIRPDLPFFVDQEGGRVQRFREGFSRLPAMLILGQRYDQAPAATLKHSRQLGWLMASELQQCGVDVSFAPVLDVERGLSRVIGNRAFGFDPARVTLLAGAFIDGMADAGMAAVGKHFPGHGAVEADSHHELPVDGRSLEQLRYDMRPFAQLISDGKLGGIMPSHVLYPALDPLRTAGFSPRWLDFLRIQLGFAGVIFSDDLSMEGAAAAGGYAERAEQAIAAGCNALVVCNRPQGAMAVLAATAQQLQNGRPLLDLSAWRNHTAVDASQLQSVRSELSAAGLLG